MIHELHAVCDKLRLGHTRETVAEAIQEAQRRKTSYSKFLLDVLAGELEYQRTRTIANRIKHCGLQDYWTLESFPWDIQKKAQKHRKAVGELAELDFLDRGESVVFMGEPGVGKSGLAAGLLLKTLYAGRTGRCIKAQDLFDELKAGQADRMTKSLIKRLSRVDLLVIDEFGYVQAPDTAQVNHLFRLMDIRASRKSVMVTTNLGWEEWAKFLNNKPLTAALLSRLLQKCHVFLVEGENLRDPKFKLPATAPMPEALKPD